MRMLVSDAITSATNTFPSSLDYLIEVCRTLFRTGMVSMQFLSCKHFALLIEAIRISLYPNWAFCTDRFLAT